MWLRFFTKIYHRNKKLLNCQPHGSNTLTKLWKYILVARFTSFFFCGFLLFSNTTKNTKLACKIRAWCELCIRQKYKKFFIRDIFIMKFGMKKKKIKKLLRKWSD